MTAMEQMKAAAKDLSDYLGFTPPIPVDDIEEEDLKSELLEAATQLVETDTLARSTARTLGEIGAVMPEGIEIVDDEPVEEPEEKPKPKKEPAPKKKESKGGKAPAKPKKESKKQEPKKEKPNPKKPASTPPPPVKSRAGRANTIKRREYMSTLIREGKWTHRQIVMKVAGQFPEYSPLTVITDLANAGSPDYCFYENVVGQKPTGELYFTKEKGNGRYYYGTKAEPRGAVRKKAEPKAKKETPKAAPKKKASAKKEAAKKEKPAPKKAAAKPKKEAKPKAVSKKKEAPKKEGKKKAPAKKAAPKKTAKKKGK